MSERGIEGLGTVLGVWAHPDDEAYLSAALMARAVRNGDRVVCVTATRGEEGSWDEERWPPAELGAIRQAELERCLAILGVTEHHWLDYLDGRVDEVPDEEGTERIAAFMAEVRPDSVFTFGPEGMTDHPDHKAVHRWTGAAFDRVAKPGARLFHAVVTPDWAERWKPKLDRFNVFLSPETPRIVERADLAIEWDLPDDVLDLKYRAIREHVSQTEGFANAFGPDFLRDSNAGEFFFLARTK
jgi:LmbE family N-acetylglucosaminyl deacetylase